MVFDAEKSEAIGDPHREERLMMKDMPWVLCFRKGDFANMRMK